MSEPAAEFTLSPIKLVALGVGALFVGFIVLLGTREVQRNEPNSDIIGQAVPPVAGTSFDGEVFDIDDILAANRGLEPESQTWVVVNFFASWCTGCRQEHGDLIRFETEGASCPTQLVGVTFQDSAQNVADYFDDLGGDWPVLVGDTGWPGQSVVDDRAAVFEGYPVGGRCVVTGTGDDPESGLCQPGIFR